MKELVDTPIRVTNVQPGMVETEFSLVRYYGDKAAADKVYDGIEALTADDIAEEIVWAASRPPHVNVAEVRPRTHPDARPPREPGESVPCRTHVPLNHGTEGGCAASRPRRVATYAYDLTACVSS